jgi:hypothetical protein
MRSVARARPLDGGRYADEATCLHERGYVLDPCAFVEIERKKPTGLVFQRRIHAHDVPPLKMREDRRVVGWDERLIRAFTTLHSRRSQTPLEFVMARRRITGFSALLAHELCRKYVLTAAEQTAKEGDLSAAVGGIRISDTNGIVTWICGFGATKSSLSLNALMRASVAARSEVR